MGSKAIGVGGGDWVALAESGVARMGDGATEKLLAERRRLSIFDKGWEVERPKSCSLKDAV